MSQLSDKLQKKLAQEEIEDLQRKMLRMQDDRRKASQSGQAYCEEDSFRSPMTGMASIIAAEYFSKARQKGEDGIAFGGQK